MTAREDKTALRRRSLGEEAAEGLQAYNNMTKLLAPRKATASPMMAKPPSALVKRLRSMTFVY
jgi:hypothetical protein